MIATGAWPAKLNVLAEEHLTPERSVPKWLAFIGGYIPFEFSHVAVRAGSRVTIPHQVVGVDGHSGHFQVSASSDSKVETFEADMVVHAAGRQPELARFEPAERAHVEFHERSGVRVNEYLQQRFERCRVRSGRCCE